MADSDSEESSVGLVVEASLPYRWDGTRVVPIDPSVSSSWSVISARDPTQSWGRFVTSIFAIRQLQQWFSAAGRGLQLVNPALRDRVAKQLGR